MSKFTSFLAHTMGISLIATLIAVAMSSMTARILGPEGRGTLALLVLIPILVMTFGRLGVGHAINFYASRWPREQLVSATLALAIVSGVLMTLVAVPVTLALRDILFHGTTVPLILLACSLIPFAVLQDFVPSLYQGYYDITRRNLLILAGPVLNLVLLLPLLLIMDYGVTGATLAYVVANIVVALWAARLAFAMLGDAPFRPTWFHMRALLAFGVRSHTGLVLKELNYRGNTLLVSYFLGPAGVGIYSAAVNVAEMLWKIPDAVGTVLLPNVAQLPDGAGGAFAARVFRALIIPMTLVTIAVFACGHLIVWLMFGSEFDSATVVLWWLLPGVFAMAFWKILANTLIGLGHPTKYSVTSGVGLVVMLGLDLVLIPTMGLVGAAIASSLAYLTATAHIVWLFCRVTGLPFSALWRVSAADFGFYVRTMRQLKERTRRNGQ